MAALCTRRSGKTRGWLRKMLYDAVTKPDCKQVYVNTTFTECERLAWRGIKRLDGLLGLNEAYALGGKPNQTKLRIDFPANNSTIELVAADNERATQKLLGGAYDRVWIDEAQKMPHIQRLIEQVLGPAMMDYDGQIVMTGTPGRHCTGYFYEITKRIGGITDEPLSPAAKGWSVHGWSVLDNPFFGETREARYARTIEREMAKRGWVGGEPDLLREYHAQWVREDAMYAYDVHKVPEHELLYAPARYTPDGMFDIDAALEDLPDLENWRFGLAADLGYNPDPFAVVIWAWSHNSPVLYELCSWEKTGLIPDAQAEVLEGIDDRIILDFMVADAGGAGGVVKGWELGWKDRRPLPIEPAEKAQKETAREWFNNDIRKGNVKLRRGGKLHEQMKVLPLRTLPNGRVVEDQRRDGEGRRKFMNDCCDAGLYGHRAAQHHRFIEPEPEPEFGTPEYWEQEEDRILEQLIEAQEEEMYGR